MRANETEFNASVTYNIMMFVYCDTKKALLIFTLQFRILGSVKFYLKENNFIWQGCNQLIKSDSKDIYKLQKIFISNKCFLFFKES